MPLERPGVDAHDLDPRSTPAVVNVHTVRRSASRSSERDRLGLDQRAQNPPRLAAERAAQRHLRPERRRQPGDPEALTAGMQVHLRAVGPGLDRDRQQRRGREHREPAGHPVPPVFWPKLAADGTATRGPVPHIASTTISRTGSTSDGTDAIVYRESALCGEPS